VQDKPGASDRFVAIWGIVPQRGDVIMRIVLALSLAVAAVFANAGVAQAQMVTAKDPSSVIKVLQNAGYKAELSKDDSGDPLIQSASSGSNFAVLFYGCTDNRNCARIQFAVTYTDKKNVGLDVFNAWNAKNYFGRVYRNEQGTARLEMDVDLDDGGMSSLLFQDNLEWWVTVMANFEKHLNGQG
jgi:hypothetical protein